MSVRLLSALLVAPAALSLAACRIDTPTGHLHSDMSGTYGAAPAQPQGPAVAPPIYAAQAATGSDASATAGGPMYDGYALAARAHAFDQSTANRPPSYAFRYQGEEPLVWRAADEASMYAEPVDGGYRDYYYAPGAVDPYFVRDDRYGYGYGPGGRLAAVYDADGALLPADRLGAVASLAAGYVLRARTLRRYGGDEGYRIAVTDAYWAERAPDFGYGPGRRHDNGRHLGWYKHADHDWRGDDGDEGEGHGKGHGHGKHGHGNGRGD
jgi:hypothetical protein